MALKVTEQERIEALEYLRRVVRPGDTVYTTLAHVSRSGMYRVVRVYKILDGKPIDLSKRLDLAGVARWDERHQGAGVRGFGQDVGCALVYDLGTTLCPEGFVCCGKGCPSNAHLNGDRDYTPHHHKDGGYALRKAWL